MTPASQPVKTEVVSFKAGRTSTTVPHCRVMGMIDASHLTSPSVIKVLKKDPEWFAKYFDVK